MQEALEAIDDLLQDPRLISPESECIPEQPWWDPVAHSTDAHQSPRAQRTVTPAGDDLTQRSELNSPQPTQLTAHVSASASDFGSSPEVLNESSSHKAESALPEE